MHYQLWRIWPISVLLVLITKNAILTVNGSITELPLLLNILECPKILFEAPKCPKTFLTLITYKFNERCVLSVVFKCIKSHIDFPSALPISNFSQNFHQNFSLFDDVITIFWKKYLDFFFFSFFFFLLRNDF